MEETTHEYAAKNGKTYIIRVYHEVDRNLCFASARLGLTKFNTEMNETGDVDAVIAEIHALADEGGASIPERGRVWHRPQGNPANFAAA